MNITGRTLETIAFDIDRHGIAAVEPAVAAVVDRALVAGVNPVVLSVLADSTQPEIARARAFGMIATELALGGARAITEAPVRSPAQLVAS